MNRTALSIDSGVMMGSPSPPTDSGIRVSPPMQIGQRPQQQKQLDKSGKTSVKLIKEKELEEGLVSSDDSESLCSSALSVQSDTSGSCYDNVMRVQNPPSVPTVKTATLVAAAAEIAASSYLTRVDPVAAGSVPHTGDEDGDDEDTDESNSESDNLDLDSYSDEESEPEEQKEEIAKEKRKPRMPLPSHRNSGPYENFRIESKDILPSSAEATCSSSSFTSNSSSPKVSRKKVSRDLKASKTEESSPTLKKHQHQQQHQLKQQHQLQQLQLQHQNVPYNISEGLANVTNSPIPYSDSSIRNFLAAGQTSNV